MPIIPKFSFTGNCPGFVYISNVIRNYVLRITFVYLTTHGEGHVIAGESDILEYLVPNPQHERIPKQYRSDCMK